MAPIGTWARASATDAAAAAAVATAAAPAAPATPAAHAASAAPAAPAAPAAVATQDDEPALAAATTKKRGRGGHARAQKDKEDEVIPA